MGHAKAQSFCFSGLFSHRHARLEHSAEHWLYHIELLGTVFPKDLQLDCLRNQPVIYGIDGACQAYFESDRTAGMYLYWKYWYSRRADPLSFQKITLIEGDNCCGFYSPFRCNHVNDTRPFPSNRDVTGVDPALTTQRVQCGAYPGFYPEQPDCQDLYDIVKGIVGGCSYDHGLGYCIMNPIKPEVVGCASRVEDTMVGVIQPIAVLTLGTVIFNVYAMLLACCMWWKRKANDVFPDINLAKGGIDYNEVRDQFEVRPLTNVLVKKGFLPETDKMRLKYLESQNKDLVQIQDDVIHSQQTSMHLSAKRAVHEEGKAGEGEEGPLPPPTGDEEAPAPPG